MAVGIPDKVFSAAAPVVEAVLPLATDIGVDKLIVPVPTIGLGDAVSPVPAATLVTPLAGGAATVHAPALLRCKTPVVEPLTPVRLFKAAAVVVAPVPPEATATGMVNAIVPVSVMVVGEPVSPAPAVTAVTPAAPPVPIGTPLMLGVPVKSGECSNA